MPSMSKMNKKNKNINEDYDFAYSTSSSYNPFEALKSLANSDVNDEPFASNAIELYFERKGRNGKPVTLVKGIAHDQLEIHAKALKTLCGVGGSVKEGEIILQGNQREKCEAYFKNKGFKTKRIGS